MKRIAKIFTSRIFLFSIAVIAQMAWMTAFFMFLYNRFSWIEFIIRALMVILVLVILNSRTDPAYRLAWSLMILVLPIFGVAFYLLYGNSRLKSRMRKDFAKMQELGSRTLRENATVRKMLARITKTGEQQSLYIRNATGFPVYVNDSAKYYATGDDAMPDMLKALEGAKNFIFMEYFIIAPGYFWDHIHAILKRKAAEGVDVRVVYDDFGCAGTLPYHYYRQLQAEGIKCACFNPLRFIASIVMNNRDHRKILVIDGKTGFTGGFNIADEYINEKVRFGHWKDAGIRLTGAPVWSLTSMFIQMWAVVTGTEEDPDRYGPGVILTPVGIAHDGFVQPYYDIPLDDERVGENVYLQLINSARKYVYIFTPYLIITDEMMTALTVAAKGGVDVRIVTPGVPDKKLVYLITQSYYRQLLDAGVKIYQYSPGFIHSKCMVADDRNAVVGSINLDYRSLYLQYEDAVWLYGTDAVREIRDDAVRTFGVSNEITVDFCRKRNILIRAFQNVLRIFAPMM